MSVGTAVKRLREAHGWKQQDLADRSGIPQATLSRIERGIDNNPTQGTLEKLAAACPDPTQAARLRAIGPHDLRHAAAVRYLRKGGQVDNLQALMGWDSPTMPAYYVEAAKHELAQSEYDRLDMDSGL